MKILDFGVARAQGEVGGETLTEVGSTVGSPHYMSPEQARGLPSVDARSDVWSLGVIAYRALTGALPFRGTAMGDIVVNVCTAPVPSVRELAPELDPAWDPFFAKALAKDPAARFQTARELAGQFAAVAGARLGAAPADGSAISSSSGLPLVHVPALSSPSTPRAELVADATTKVGTASDIRPREHAGRARLVLGVGAVSLVGLAWLGWSASQGGSAPATAGSAGAPASASLAEVPSTTPPATASAVVSLVSAPSASASSTAATQASASGRPRSSAPGSKARPAKTFDFGF